MSGTPWAAFCMSTFRRPQFLKEQLTLLLKQTFSDFEIIISDNDPEASAREIALAFSDDRIKYFNNCQNIGMIESFNKSIDRSEAEYIVMVTDDDPVDSELLSDMYNLYKKYPGLGLYGGFTRNHRKYEEIESISPANFITEIFDPHKTTWMLWSSCILNRQLLLKIGKIPNYGSPHLADHALIGMVGSKGGGVIVNKRYSHLTSHDTNYSKFNFEYYVHGCKGFYDTMDSFCKEADISDSSMLVVRKHLYYWFIANIFTLKRYYTVIKPDSNSVKRVNDCAKEILTFHFMRKVFLKYHIKDAIFRAKKNLGIFRLLTSFNTLIPQL